MKKISLLLLIFGLLMGGATAQERDNDVPQTIANLKKTVVFLTGTLTEGGDSHSLAGTGFFISVQDPSLSALDKRLTVTYLVTNKHMIRQPDDANGSHRPFFKSLFVKANLRVADGLGSYLATAEVPVTGRDGKLLWLTDAEDEDDDLALVQLGPSPALDVITLPTEIFATPEMFNTLNIDENDEVLFTGLFTAYSGAKRNYPIVRHGKLALVSDERIPLSPTHSAKLILAELTSFGGNSGSPVVLKISNRQIETVPRHDYLLLGVMKGYFNETSPFSVSLTTTLSGAVSQNNGIAAIVPAENILRILQSSRGKAETQRAVAQSYAEANKLSEAEAIFRGVMPIFESDPTVSVDEKMTVANQYALVLNKLGRKKDATDLLERIAR